MSLNKRLKFLADTMARNAGPKISAVCEQAAQNQARLATSEGEVRHCPATVPDMTLIDAAGKPRQLRDLIAGRPAVLAFFRGDWCPYSTTSMRAMEDIRAELAAHGILVVGITPRRHSALTTAAMVNLLGYPLLTDPDFKLTEAMGIRVCSLEAMKHLYESRGIDLAKLNESGEWSLPLEATFLVDAEGRIRCASAYPHPSRRMEPAEIRARMLEIVRQDQTA